MSSSTINANGVQPTHNLKLELQSSKHLEKLGSLLEEISSINASIIFHINIKGNTRELELIFPNDGVDLVKKVVDLKTVKEILQHSSRQSRKNHARSNSYDRACHRVEEDEKLEKANKALSHWQLNRTCYSELEKLRLEEFQKLLHSDIRSLLAAIEVLSSEKIRIAKETSLSHSLDSLIAASITLLGFPWAGAASGAWSFLSPVDYMVNGNEKKRLKSFSKYLDSSEKIDRISRDFASHITAYYRVDVLDPLRNLTVIEEQLESFKKIFSRLKRYYENSSSVEQYITGIDDKREKADTSYKEHWQTLRTLIIGNFFNSILLNEELFGSNVSIGNTEMNRRLIDAVTPLSDEPPDFDEESLPYTLSRLALLVYETEGIIYDFVKNKWGYEEYQFFYLDDIQAVFIADAKRVMISFRGTMPLSNWLKHNLRIQSIDVDGKSVHSGFWAGLKKMQPSIRKALQKDDDREVYITGHSLGGALALLAAYDLSNYLDNKGAKISLYTFGQPRCGDQAFVDAVTEKVGVYLRYENYLDPVPHLPRNFQHGGIRKWINSRGEVVEEKKRKEAFERLEEEENLTSFHKVINFLSRSETRAIRNNPINWALHFSNHSMIEYHKQLRKEAPGSYTPIEYIERVALQRAKKSVSHSWEGQQYRRKHPTSGDGACLIHALLGELSGGEYVYNPRQESDRDEVQKAAKQHFIDTLKTQLKNEQIEQIFLLCLQEYFYNYEKDTPLRSEYEKRLDEKKREAASSYDWLFPILEATNPDLQAELLALLRLNKKTYETLNDQQLLEIFEKDKRELYYAVAAVQDEIEILVNEIKENAIKNKDEDEGYNEQLIAYCQIFLITIEKLNRIEQKFNALTDEFLLKNVSEVYFLSVLNQDYYLSDREAELAAYLFSKKVILFSEDEFSGDVSSRVFNSDSNDCMVIEHTPGHYSRLEKASFSLPTHDRSELLPPGAFDFKPLVFDEIIQFAALKHGLVRPKRAEAIGLGFIAPIYIQGKLIQRFVNPNGYERDANWHHFRLLKTQNPPLQLFDYIEQGSARGVQEVFYKKHRSFYRHPQFSPTILPYLIFQNNAENIRFLAEKGIPVNITLEDGSPVVHHLVPFKCHNSFEALVTADDFKQDAIDNEGNTVLHRVAQHCELKAFRILHRNEHIRPILNMENSKRKTATAVATRLKHFKLVYELLSKYPDDLELDDQFLSQLVAANTESTIAFFFRAIPQSKRDAIIAFENACEERSEESILFKTQNRNILRVLIVNGIDLTKTQRGSNKTLLYILAKNNDVGLVKLFLKNLRENHPESYEKVLDQEVKSSQFNSTTQEPRLKTALIIAVEKNNYEVLQLLIEAGANFRKKVDGLNPLDYIPRISRNASYKLLWQAWRGNIRRPLTSSEKLHALHVCCTQGKFEAAQRLILKKIFPFGDQRDNDGNGLLHIVMKSRSISWEQTRTLMRLLLIKSNEANNNQADANGITPLILAAREDLEATHLLLKTQGINVNHQDKQLNTALHYAVFGNRPKTVEALLSSKADPNIPNTEGKTPLHLTNDVEIVRVLFFNGADPLVKDATGRTPRDYAELAKNTNLAKFLKKCEDYKDIKRDFNTF